MAKIIDQYMWGLQHYFRVRVENQMKDVLSDIGLQASGSTKVILIGLATRGELKHRICIEPENGPLEVDDLETIDERSLEIAKADPEAQVFISDPRFHEIRRRELYLRSRARAVAEAIQQSGRFDGLSFFVSNSAPINGYEVHTCVGLPRDVVASVPRFNNPKKNDYHGWHIEESFFHALVHTCLDRSDKALYLPEPGALIGSGGVLGNRDDIIRSSAERFVDGVCMALGSMPSDLFRRINEISSLTYERSGAKGNLIVTGRDNIPNKLGVSFQDQVTLSQTRSVRKILELTDENKGMLTDGFVVFGLGQCNSAPDVAKIDIESNSKWSLSIDGKSVLKVTNEHASLPRPILDREFVSDVAERTAGVVEFERIWEIIQCALESAHGTTIVVTQDPVAETSRLSQQGLAIKPEYLDEMDVVRLGRVDGAILLGPDARCYAFGVILDGLASGKGDRARGARFNSSVRYQQTSSVGTMIIVISDDGTVDVIPNMKPRVWKQAVEDAVRAFCEYSGVDGNDGEEWARRNRQIEGYAFYLNQEQCDRVNEAYEQEMDSRLESGGIKMMRNGLKPDPDMNKSYFLD